MDFMIDIETLGTKPGSVIAQIGVLQFWPMTGHIGAGLRINVDIAVAQSVGMQIDAATVAWWLKQDKAAQTAVFGGDQDRVSPYLALAQLRSFITESMQLAPIPENYKVWANSPTFDLAHLEHAAMMFGTTVPWNYRQQLDVRTLCNVAQIDWKEFADETTGPLHDALFDCHTQARAVIEAYHRLGTV